MSVIVGSYTPIPYTVIHCSLDKFIFIACQIDYACVLIVLWYMRLDLEKPIIYALLLL